MAVSISIGIKQNNCIIENNKSNVTVTVTAKWTYGSFNKISKSGWLKIDGEKYTFNSPFNTGQSTTGSEVIFEKTVDVSHKSDGSKTLVCSASYTSGVSSGTVTASASKALVAIPQKSTLSAENGELGKSQKLTVTRQSTKYTHTIMYADGDKVKTICEKSSATEIWFTPPFSLANNNKTGLYVPVVFTIETYNGEDYLGATTKTINCYIPDSSETNPTVSLSVTDAMNYASTYGGYIQNKSKLKVVVNADGKEGADIKSYKTTIDDTIYTTDSFTTEVIPKSGSITITTTVTDSRGRKAETTKAITVLEYSPPKITNLSVYRSNSNGGANEAGQYITINFSAEVSKLNKTNSDGTVVAQNTAAYKYQYRKVESSGDFSGADIKALNNNFNPNNYTCTFLADDKSSYDVSISVTDKFGTIKKSGTGQTATKLWSIFKKGLGFAFGKIATVKNALDVAWNLIARKDIYMGYYHDNEKNIFFKNNAEQTGKTYTANGLYPHNCRLYGGSAGSPIGIGFYDTKKKRRIFAYNDHEDYVETQVNIRQHIYQAHQKEATTISADVWTKIKLGTSSLDSNDLNPTLNNDITLTRFFKKTDDGGVECKCSGYVMVSGQVYLKDLISGDVAGACISQESTNDKNQPTNTNIAWNYVKHEVASAYVPVMPTVVSVKSGDVFFLNGRNFGKTYGTAAIDAGTKQVTRLVIQYVG